MYFLEIDHMLLLFGANVVTKPMAKVLLNNLIEDIGHDTQSKSHVKKMCDEIDKIPVHKFWS